MNDEIKNPRSYLLRTATNIWIDEVRHRSVVARYDGDPQHEVTEIGNAELLAEVSDASYELLRLLPPKQLAAVLMKDIFDAST